jgi:hypothetical protein
MCGFSNFVGIFSTLETPLFWLKIQEIWAGIIGG